MSLLTPETAQAINESIDAWIAQLVVKCGDMRRYRVALEEKE